MTKITLTSLALFDEPLAYHQGACTFLEFHADEVVRRAHPVIVEIERSHPDKALAFQQVIKALGQRLHDESIGHGHAVAYLMSHRQTLTMLEASLSGGVPPTFAAPSAGNALSWAVPDHRAVKGVVGELRRLLGQVEHELYQLDSDLGSLEAIVLDIKRDLPLPLHLVPGIDGLIQDVYAAIYNVRAVYDKVFLPAIDGEIAQPFIDYLLGVQEAYQAYVRQLLEPITSPFLAGYTPPPHAAQYQASLAVAPSEQRQTYTSFESIITGLQSAVDHSEIMTGLQLELLGFLLAAAGLVTALIVSVGLSIEVSGPGLIKIGFSAGEITVDLTAIGTALAGALEGLASTEIPLWAWFTIGAVLTLPNLLEHPLTNDAAIDNSSIVNTKWDETTLGRELNARELSDGEEQIAQSLAERWGLQEVPIDIIRQIIRLNPGLTEAQYDLLVDNYVKNGVIPWDVQNVVEDPDGTVRYLPKNRDIHVSEHPLSGSTTTGEEFRDKVMSVVRDEKPVFTKGDDNYYRIKDNEGKEHIIDVVISSNPDSTGMIVTAYEPDNLPFPNAYLII